MLAGLRTQLKCSSFVFQWHIVGCTVDLMLLPAWSECTMPLSPLNVLSHTHGHGLGRMSPHDPCRHTQPN
eukprot:520199-Amphidinium_carterae.1